MKSSLHLQVNVVSRAACDYVIKLRKKDENCVHIIAFASGPRKMAKDAIERCQNSRFLNELI